MNNLWAYLQGLALTTSNRQWLANKLVEETRNMPKDMTTKYHISERRKRLMAKIAINPDDFQNDERAKYILSR